MKFSALRGIGTFLPRHAKKMVSDALSWLLAVIYRIKPCKHSESAQNPCQIVFRENLVFKIALRADQSAPPPRHRFPRSEISRSRGSENIRPLGNHCTIIQRINQTVKIKPICIKTLVFDTFLKIWSGWDLCLPVGGFTTLWFSAKC